MGWLNPQQVVRDISHHNTITNYGEFRAHTDSVQIKITESTDFIDNAGQYNHDNCFGVVRAPYHFARPVSLSGQISHFLRRKEQIGHWERPDMLDCEFDGITGAFIRTLKEEYRKQSGINRVQIYIGLHDIVTTCPPDQWWDEDVFIQVARYRKIGPPNDPDLWKTHLGFDHIGLTTYQWDNATPFYPGGPVGDVSFDRLPVLLTPPKIEATVLTRKDNELYTSITLGVFGQSNFKSAVRFEDGTFVEITTDAKALKSVQAALDKGIVPQISCDNEDTYNNLGGGVI